MESKMSMQFDQPSYKSYARFEDANALVEIGCGVVLFVVAVALWLLSITVYTVTYFENEVTTVFMVMFYLVCAAAAMTTLMVFRHHGPVEGMILLCMCTFFAWVFTGPYLALRDATYTQSSASGWIRVMNDGTIPTEGDTRIPRGFLWPLSGQIWTSTKTELQAWTTLEDMPASRLTTISLRLKQSKTLEDMVREHLKDCRGSECALSVIGSNLLWKAASIARVNVTSALQKDSVRLTGTAVPLSVDWIEPAFIERTTIVVYGRR